MELSLDELQWIETAMTWSATDNGPVPTGWSNLLTRVRDHLDLAKAERKRQEAAKAGQWAPDMEDISLAIFNALAAKCGWVGDALEGISDMATEIASRELDKQALAAGFVRVRADDLDRQICMTPVSALVTQADHDVEQRLCHALATVKPKPKE